MKALNAKSKTQGGRNARARKAFQARNPQLGESRNRLREKCHFLGAGFGFQPRPDRSETLRAIGERRHAMVKSDKRRYPRTGATGKEAGGTLIWC